jgi:hypothetical protein
MCALENFPMVLVGRWAQARPAAGLNYAAASRLDGIGRCAIGDMVFTPSMSRSEDNSTLYERNRYPRDYYNRYFVWAQLHEPYNSYKNRVGT